MSAPTRATARPPESGALGERSLRCCGTAYVFVLVVTIASVRSQFSNVKFTAQGYEVTDEEVQIKLDEFKQKYVDEKGYPRCAHLDCNLGSQDI